MKIKLTVLCLAVVLLMGLTFCGCSKAQESETPDNTVPAVTTPDNTSAAVDFLKAQYMNEPDITGTDYSRYGKIKLQDENFIVTWSVDVGEDLIKIVPGDSIMVNIDINEECKEDTPYILTATVTDAAGRSAQCSWNYTLPAGMDMVQIVDTAYQLADGESMDKEVSLTGKLISIDTIYNADFQNITVSIAVEGAEDKPIKCYRLKGDGAKDLCIGNIITVSGTIKNYSGTIEFDSGCVLVKVEPGTAVTPLTDPYEILQSAYALKEGASLPYQVTLTGTVTKIQTPYNPDYSNISVVMEVEGSENRPVLCYRLKGDVEYLAVGDLITVTGMIVNYQGTIEFNAGSQMTHCLPGGEEIPPSSDEAQILSDLSALKPGQKLRYVATLTGKVTSIDFAYDADYHNITVTIDVNGTAIQCFRLVGEGVADIAVGDTITVIGNMENYSGKLEFSAASTLLERIPG